MAEILELQLEKPQQNRTVANPGLKPKESFESKKLRDAIETLEKHPVPAWIFLKRYSATQQEEGICINGILKSADVASNSLVVAVIVNEYAQSNYHIRTTPETLTKIVKNYWNETITAQIRPQINKDNQFEYELMVVK